MTESDKPTGIVEEQEKAEQVSQSYWALVWWKFKKNRTAVLGGIMLAIFYIVCVFFAEFFAPYPKETETSFIEAQPTSFHFRDPEGKFSLRPFVYGLEKQIDEATRKRTFVIDTTKQYPVYFFVKGEENKDIGVHSNPHPSLWNRSGRSGCPRFS